MCARRPTGMIALCEQSFSVAIQALLSMKHIRAHTMTYVTNLWITFHYVRNEKIKNILKIKIKKINSKEK